MTAPQARFINEKIATIGKMPANQTNGSPVTGTTPCSSGIRQPCDAAATYAMAPMTLSESRTRGPFVRCPKRFVLLGSGIGPAYQSVLPAQRALDLHLHTIKDVIVHRPIEGESEEQRRRSVQCGKFLWGELVRRPRRQDADSSRSCM